MDEKKSGTTSSSSKGVIVISDSESRAVSEEVIGSVADEVAEQVAEVVESVAEEIKERIVEDATEVGGIETVNVAASATNEPMAVKDAKLRFLRLRMLRRRIRAHRRLQRKHVIHDGSSDGEQACVSKEEDIDEMRQKYH